MTPVVDKVVDDKWAVDNLKTAIGERFRLMRKELGLTQKSLCAVMEKPLPSIRDYERGKSIPGGDAISSLVRAGVNANWLLSGEGPMMQADLLLEGARLKRATARIAEARWQIVRAALAVVPHRWFAMASNEPDDPLIAFVEDYNAGRSFSGSELLRESIPSLSLSEIKAWGCEALAWGDRLSKAPGLFPGLALRQEPPAINIDALVQAVCVSLQTAPKGEPVEKSARKAVEFYLYCLDKGLITPEGEGEGDLPSVA